MSATQSEIDLFHQFGSDRAKDGRIESFDDLFVAWNSYREQAETNASISRCLDDVEAGRYRLTIYINFQRLRKAHSATSTPTITSSMRLVSHSEIGLP